ncbi:hypothetical protein TNIN_154121 [Trichonephila inaurata madagascariensis]|uniref:Uncharacterized protein n=1 Tax=Trichonephila inaurata madagascariensis TaxID=2747483 RepID=A0A8X7C7W5_9ARAC|nr:hypothetical protein TNIN_154121 [Trichonephila inaurata madagascariensis]
MQEDLRLVFHPSLLPLSSRSDPATYCACPPDDEGYIKFSTGIAQEVFLSFQVLKVPTTLLFENEIRSSHRSRRRKPCRGSAKDEASSFLPPRRG